jgi:hypothetical protein
VRCTQGARPHARRHAQVSSVEGAPATQQQEHQQQQQQHQQAFPARVLDVARHPYRDLIATSAVSSLQLEFYLFSRRTLLLLALGLPRRALDAAAVFLARMRAWLRRAYDADWDVVDAWCVAAALEVVAAGHGCAAVFAGEVSAPDRVAMSARQAELCVAAPERGGG